MKYYVVAYDTHANEEFPIGVSTPLSEKYAILAAEGWLEHFHDDIVMLVEA